MRWKWKLRRSDNCASEVKGVKDEVMQAMNQNEDVLFYWSMVSANWESEEASVLLDMIMELWVTMHGFSLCWWIHRTISTKEQEMYTEIKRAEKNHNKQ